MKMPKFIHRNKWILLFAVIYSAAVFVFSPQAALLYDSALYADIGKNLISSLCFCSNFEAAPSTAPILPILIAFSMQVFGSIFIKALLAGIAFFGILISYHFVLRISNMRTALLSTTLLFLSPLFIYNSMLLLQDLLFAALTILSMWAYVNFLEKKRTRSIVIVALTTALAIMTKLFGYILIPVFIAHFLLERKRHKISFKSLALMLLLTVVFLAPWNVWRYSLGLNEATVGDIYLFGGNYGHVLLRIESFYGSGEPVNTNPLVLDTNVPFQAVNLVRLLTSIFIYLAPVIPLYFAYKLTKHKKGFKGKYDSLLLIWLSAFLAFFVLGFYYFGSRYLMAAALPMVYFFARFADSSLGKKKLIALTIIAVHLISMAAITYADSQFIWTKSQIGIFEEAGTWLKENTYPDSTILLLGAPQGAMLYYSERRVIWTTSDILPDYVVLSDFEGPKDISSYQKETHIALEKIKEFSDGKYYAQIYRRVA